MKTDKIRECLSYLRDMDVDRETLSEATTELTALGGSAMSIERHGWNAALAEAAGYFERMVAEGDTEPLSPSAVARMIRGHIRSGRSE